MLRNVAEIVLAWRECASWSCHVTRQTSLQDRRSQRPKRTPKHTAQHVLVMRKDTTSVLATFAPPRSAHQRRGPLIASARCARSPPPCGWASDTAGTHCRREKCCRARMKCLLVLHLRCNPFPFTGLRAARGAYFFKFCSSRVHPFRVKATNGGSLLTS